MTRKHIPKPGDAKLRQDGSAQAAPGLIGHCSQGCLARQNCDSMKVRGRAFASGILDASPAADRLPGAAENLPALRCNGLSEAR